MDIGRRLQELRIENHVSQETLAEVLAVSRQTISRWESNQTSPNMEFIQKLCTYYHMDISDFFKEEKTKKTSILPYIAFLFFVLLIIFSTILPHYQQESAGSMIIITPSMVILWFGVIGTIISSCVIYMSHKKKK